MQKLPFRTNKTWISDSELILLDVLFACRVRFRYLRREIFGPQWFLGYSHSLDDFELRRRLEFLCERDVLICEEYGDETIYTMTAMGGELWSQERCPIWERFCTERYKRTVSGRELMSIVAISQHVQDEFLQGWAPSSARRRNFTISDYGLINWHSFNQLHVGIAIYNENNQSTPDEALEHHCQKTTYYHHNRGWWRSVPELQKFLIS